MLGLRARQFLGFSQRQYTRNFSYSPLRRFPRNASKVSQDAAAPVVAETTVSFADKVGRPSIRNQVLFFVLGSSSVFLYSAWRTDLDTAQLLQKLKAQSSIWTVQNITNVDLIRFQQSELVQKLRSWFAYLNTRGSEIPALLQPYINVAYIAIWQPYADASEGRRLCWKICLLNLGIWTMWKIRKLQPFMNRNFTHHPLSGLSFTLLSNVFSHASFLHLAMNTLALESFGSAAYTYLQKSQSQNAPTQLESTSVHHFLAFYLSAGVFANLLSHTVCAKFTYPKLVAQLASPASVPKVTETWASAVASASAAAAATTSKTVAASAAPTILPSLGASGAIYACVTMTALAFPNAQVSLIIPPSYPIDIQTGVAGLVALDIIGVLRGWKAFDHWAHLGGAVFGATYYMIGPKLWTSLRSETSLREKKRQQSE